MMRFTVASALFLIGCVHDESAPQQVVEIHEDGCGTALEVGDPVHQGTYPEFTIEIPTLSPEVFDCELVEGVWDCPSAGADVLTLSEEDRYGAEYRLDRPDCAVTFAVAHPLVFDEAAAKEVVLVNTLGPIGVGLLFVEAYGRGMSAMASGSM